MEAPLLIKNKKFKIIKIMGTQNISQESFAWAHFGTILFHSIIASLLIWWTRTDINYAKLKKYVFWTGIILLVVSILALWPIFSHYNDGHKYIIEMK